LSEEETAGADGEDGAFFVGVFLLEVGEGFDEAEGLGGFGFEDGVGATAGDDEDVEFGEAGVGFFVVHVSPETGSLGGDGVLFGRDKGSGEGFGGCIIDIVSGMSQDFKGANEVHGVHASMKCE